VNKDVYRIIIQETHRGSTVCRKSGYFASTDNERFYFFRAFNVLYVFSDVFLHMRYKISSRSCVDSAIGNESVPKIIINDTIN